MKQDKSPISLKEVYKFLAENEREIAYDINYASELLLTYLNEAVEKIKQRISNATNDDDYEMEMLMMSYRNVLNTYRENIEEFLNFEISKNNIYEDINNKAITSSENYYNIDEDFTNRKIQSFSFADEIYPVKNWRFAIVTFCEILSKKYPEKFTSAIKSPNFQGRTRPLFIEKRPNKKDENHYLKINKTKVYVLVNNGANATIQNIIKLLDYFQLSKDTFKICLIEN